MLRSLGERDEAFPVPESRADHVRHGGGPDSRDQPERTRDIFIPEPHSGPGIKVPTRDFR